MKLLVPTTSHPVDLVMANTFSQRIRANRAYMDPCPQMTRQYRSLEP